MSATMSAATESAQERQQDALESRLQAIDESTKRGTGISLFHMLAIGSIGAAIALFLSGKRETGIFVGLWAPTFEALKSAADRRR